MKENSLNRYKMHSLFEPWGVSHCGSGPSAFSNRGCLLFFGNLTNVGLSSTPVITTEFLAEQALTVSLIMVMWYVVI